jgi:hypothetical protein
MRPADHDTPYLIMICHSSPMQRYHRNAIQRRRNESGKRSPSPASCFYARPAALSQLGRLLARFHQAKACGYFSSKAIAGVPVMYSM